MFGGLFLNQEAVICGGKKESHEINTLCVDATNLEELGTLDKSRALAASIVEGDKLFVTGGKIGYVHPP